MLSYPIQDDVYLGLLLPHHAPALAKAVRANVDYLGRWLDFATPEYSTDDATNFIRYQLEQLADSKGMVYGIFHQQDVIGTVGFNRWDFYGKTTEIGYWLAKSWQGHGITTRAVQALTNYAFGPLGLNRIEILMDVANERSERVAQRLGYDYEGVRHQYVRRRDGSWRDLHSYYMLTSMWQDPSQPYTRFHDLLWYEIDQDLHLELSMPQHAEAAAELAQADYHYLKPWIPWAKEDYTKDDAEAMFKRYLKRLADNNGMSFSIFYQGEFVGTCLFLYWNWQSQRTEMGYWIGQRFQGKGIVTRSVQALTNFAINELGLNRIEIITDKHNEISGKVALRVGYQYENSRRHYFMHPANTPVDVHVYVMLAENWPQKSN